MRVLARVLPAILAAGHGALALHAEDAGKVDWHKKQIGIPLSEPRFAPNFHRVPPYRFGQPWKSVVLTATEANVLAGINPADGALDNLHQTM
ncbi:hypothetical protein AURDEDRAFT_177255 [Auricularia subglabra TFB-10046 SS5]|uniref:Uncharacterized protein n=1 Tax=Auricularia subglabra (strain TFB-10046 / SS5) TaxID=717982 RepID=J0WP66_AURST|nr:hypothetical protein AURDEDRAFT_177255 [Auricularia subglabra TFB-10046 SS5]